MMDEDFYRPHYTYDHTHDKYSTVKAMAVGWLIGAWIDNNTRFGWWINNSATANLIFAVLKGAAIMVAVTLFILFWYYFFTG